MLKKKHQIFMFVFIIINLTSKLQASENTQLLLSISGGAIKNHQQQMTINLDINNPTSMTADIYLAVLTPEQNFYFIQANELFGQSYTTTTKASPYAANLAPGNVSGVAWSIPPFSNGLPFGYYTFYAVAVKAKLGVYDSQNWLSGLVKQSLSIEDPSSTLPIPPLMMGEINSRGQTRFDLNLQQGQHSFLSGTKTATFGINGNYLGPTIRVSRNTPVLFNIKNELGEDTTIHWHGAHIPANMDGGPHQIIKAGETWLPNFTINQPASTLWYHPHLLGKTAEHVIKGLAGFFIIDDQYSKQLKIPQNYAVDDIPIVIQDRIINADGGMPYELFRMQDVMRGYRGDKMVVNGAIKPEFNAASEVIRLRILNGSNARVYNLGFNDNRTFYQIASDGGFFEKSVPLQRLRLSPGERGEILLDLRKDLNKFRPKIE